MAAARELTIRPLTGIPEIAQGDNLGSLIVAAAEPGDDEIVVLSQKIVSKAEGRTRRLSEVEPGRRAVELAERSGHDPRLVELALSESKVVLRAEPGVLICETHSGWICANAGIDASNVADGEVALLPRDPDGSARRVRAEIREASKRSPAVLVADSFGRPWRLGQADVAIGCAGLAPIDDWRGRKDANGRALEATAIATADQLAAAADLVRDKDSGVPGAAIGGLGGLVTVEDGPGAVAIQRPTAEDLFR